MAEHPGRSARQPESPVPWTLMPSAWLIPCSSGPVPPWRREVRLSPRPLTPYSTGWVEQLLPGLCRRISGELALPSAGVELRWVNGHLYARPLPLKGWARWLPFRAAQHGLRAGQTVGELVRWWETGGLTALLADVAELRLRVVAQETAAATGWRRVLERASELWATHLHRLLSAEALATLLRWQLQVLLEAFGIVQREGIHADHWLSPPAVASEVNHRLGQLAVHAGTVKQVRRLLTGSTPQELRHRLSQVPTGRAGLGGNATEFFALWRQFLERFGHLAWPPAELAAATWAEDPGAALQVLATFLQDGARDPEGADIPAERRRQQVAARARHLLKGRPLDLRRLETTLRLAEAAGRLAAEMGYQVLHLRAWWRRAVVGAGKALVAGGVLSEADEVWFLTPDELLKALPGGPTHRTEGHGTSIRQWIQERRSRWQEALQSEPPPAVDPGGTIVTSPGGAPVRGMDPVGPGRQGAGAR